MDSIPRDVILEFNEQTLQTVRKDYELDTPERINEALDILEEWVKMQEHFLKKDFARTYLERVLIACKGSVERTKARLDRTCTLKTLLPTFYENINLKTDFEYADTINHALLPKLTEDNFRIYMLRNVGKKFDFSFMNYFRFTIRFAEYVMSHDYSKGIILVMDYLDANLLEHSKRLDIMEMRQGISLLMEGYGMKINGIYIITPSKTAENMIAIFKQFLSTKVSDLIKVLKDYESLFQILPRHMFPEEVGGQEKSLKKLHDQWVDVLSTNEFEDYFQEMKKASTNEIYRKKDQFNENYMGMPGTFRSLSVD